MYRGCVLDEVIKKPTRVQDQTAHDAQGRRRFHGAFTGGFSAGYFNTVGSEQGEVDGQQLQSIYKIKLHYYIMYILVRE